MGPVGAVITAGGRSSRLGELGAVIPKGLLPLAAPGATGPAPTAIGRLVEALRLAGVDHIVVSSTDHRWFDDTAASFGIGKVEVPPTGEFDAVRLGWQALPRCELGVVVSSDNVFPGKGLTALVEAPDREASLVAAAPKVAIRRYTEVATAADDRYTLARVSGLVEKPDRDGGGLAKAGAYRFPGPVLDELVARGVDRDRFGERSMTEAMLRVMGDGPVLAYELAESFLDIGTPAGLGQAIEALAERGETGALAPRGRDPSPLEHPS